LEKVLVALSGGIDSTATILFLQKQGFLVHGLHFLFNDEDPADVIALSNIFSFPLEIVDLRAEFQQEIVGYMTGEYTKGLTPNPCVECNKKMKWRYLIEAADRLGIFFISTGHYARITHDDGQHQLRTAVDKSRDQSYFLYGLSKSIIERAILPLGEHLRSDVVSLVQSYGIDRSNLRHSRDLCFLERGKLGDYLSDRVEFTAGDIYHIDGRLLGTHPALQTLTVGQRRGMGIAGSEPVYVLKIDIPNRKAIVGPQRFLLQKKFIVRDVTWIDGFPPLITDYTVRIRSTHPGAPATVLPQGEFYEVTMESPVLGVTPGQSAVFYHGDIVRGGGVMIG
jgi:tRNA-uridine 2-sulfurtransferase